VSGYASAEAGKWLELLALQEISNPADGFRTRDGIKQFIARRLKEHTTEHWLGILNTADIWWRRSSGLAQTLRSEALSNLPGCKPTGKEQESRFSPPAFCFPRIGGLLTSEELAPRVGQHTETIQREFGI